MTFGGGIMLSGRPAVVHTLFVVRDISLLSGEILMKPATDFRHVSGHYSKGVQGQRSKVKVITR